MEKKINKYKIRIGKISIEPDEFIIESTDKQIFRSKIIRGSVNFRIYNEDLKEVSLSNIEEDDIITIYGSTKKLENLLNNKRSLFNELSSDANKLISLIGGTDKLNKNKIIIKKIIIKNKYDFNMDSSEEITDSE